MNRYFSIPRDPVFGFHSLLGQRWFICLKERCNASSAPQEEREITGGEELNKGTCWS